MSKIWFLLLEVTWICFFLLKKKMKKLQYLKRKARLHSRWWCWTYIAKFERFGTAIQNSQCKKWKVILIFFLHKTKYLVHSEKKAITLTLKKKTLNSNIQKQSAGKKLKKTKKMKKKAENDTRLVFVLTSNNLNGNWFQNKAKKLVWAVCQLVSVTSFFFFNVDEKDLLIVLEKTTPIAEFLILFFFWNGNFKLQKVTFWGT